jgi:hypothetical protein
MWVRADVRNLEREREIHRSQIDELKRKMDEIGAGGGPVGTMQTESVEQPE